jgi:hypothetical protein
MSGDASTPAFAGRFFLPKKPSRASLKIVLQGVLIEAGVLFLVRG